MNQFTKVLITVGAVILFILLFGVVAGISESNGRTPGILGIILLAGLIGALRALWKKEKPEDKENKEDKDNTNSILQK